MWGTYENNVISVYQKKKMSFQHYSCMMWLKPNVITWLDQLNKIFDLLEI